MRQSSEGPIMPLHDAASAIRDRQVRKQRIRQIPAGEETFQSNQTSGDDNDDPEMSFRNFPRLTRQQARQLNLQVSAEGLPPKTRQRK